MTRDELAATVAVNLNDGSAFYTPDDLNSSIQDAYDEIVSLTACYPKATTISVAANTTYYDLLTLIPDFCALRAIYNARVRRWLVPKTPLWLDSQRLDWEIQLGEPEFFAVYNHRYVGIYPRVSSASGEFWIFYYAQANTLAGSDTPTLPSISGEQAIEHYTTADLFEQAEEWVKAQEYYQGYLESLGEVERFRDTLRLPDYLPVLHP